jgi:hypothetical protein
MVGRSGKAIQVARDYSVMVRSLSLGIGYQPELAALIADGYQLIAQRLADAGPSDAHHKRRIQNVVTRPLAAHLRTLALRSLPNRPQHHPKQCEACGKAKREVNCVDAHLGALQKW